MYIIDPNVLHYISDRTQISEQFDLSYLSWLLKTECVGSFSFARSANRRPSHCPIQSERATQKPTPICIMTLECTFDRQRRTKDINIPRRHLLLLCFGWILEFAKFCRAKNKTSSKRLFYICIFPTSLTSLRKYRRGKRGKDSNLINRTKIYSAIFSDVS